MGMVMFGLSVAAVLLLVVVGGSAFGGTEVSGTHNAYLLGMSADLGWGLFVSLFLGWLAAMGGASTAHRELPHTAVQQQHVRA